MSRAVKKSRKIGFTAFVLIVAILLGILLTCLDFFVVHPGATYASGTVELLYTGAAQGLAPNRERFSIEPLCGENVITKALEKTGLAEKYSVEEVQSNLSVSGNYPKEIVRMISDYDSLLDFSAGRTVPISNYYPTSYTAILRSGFSSRISKAALKSLLNAILECYQEEFRNLYSFELQLDGADELYSVADYDYSQQVSVLNTRLNILSDYAAKLFAEDRNYTYRGNTFQEIETRCRQLAETEIAALQANLTVNAMTRDAGRLLNQYEYEIEVMQNQVIEKTAQMKEVIGLIADYEKDYTLFLSDGESVLKVESNSTDTYNALVAERLSIADEITELNASISENKMLISDLKKNQSVSGKTAIADLEADIRSAEQQVNIIFSDLQAMLQDYNNTVMPGNAVTLKAVRSSAPSLFSGAFVARGVKCGGPVILLALILISVSVISKRRREYNQKLKKRAAAIISVPDPIAEPEQESFFD